MSSTEIIEPEKTLSLSLIRPVAGIADLVKFHQDVRNVINDVLIEDQDYGTIPGTSKPTLLKPGAEKICIAFGAAPKYEKIECDIDHDREVKWTKKKKVKVWNNNTEPPTYTYDYEYENGISYGLYRYLYKCKIVRSDGRDLGEGEGVCSTLESKFIDRPRDCENTICKMSQKRAFVAGVLNAFGLSECFTQDMEDQQYQDNGNEEEKKETNKKPWNNQTGEKVYLNVAYSDRNEAKRLGAKWDNNARSWYVFSGNTEALKHFGNSNEENLSIDLGSKQADFDTSNIF